MVFNDYLTRDETRDLLKAYKYANMKRFHYMNAATLNLNSVKWLYSYYTAIIGASNDYSSKYAYLYVQPFIWDTEWSINSRTTNKQTNKWLYENGFNVTVSDLRAVYNLAKDGFASYPLTMNDGKLVIPRFNYAQTRINRYGEFDYKNHCSEVPYLAYNDTSDALIVVGKFVHRGKECGLVRY